MRAGRHLPGVPDVEAQFDALKHHGEALGWHLPDAADGFWDEQWLSPERFTLRDFRVAGHFDYRRHLGWDEPGVRGLGL